MRRWLTIALGGLVLSCQGPAAVLAQEAANAATVTSPAEGMGQEARRNRMVPTRSVPGGGPSSSAVATRASRSDLSEDAPKP